MTSLHGPPEEVYANATLPQVSFLPQEYHFESGLGIRVRAVRKDEDRTIYAMMMDAVKKGAGYGTDEWPTLDTFRLYMLMESPCFVFEDLSNGKVRLFLFASHSARRRQFWG